MKAKDYFNQSPAAFCASLVLLLFSVSLYPLNVVYAVSAFLCTVIVFVLTLLLIRRQIKHTKKALTSVEKSMNFSDHEAISTFPLPVLIGNAEGKVVWYNNLFASWVIGNKEVTGRAITQFTSGCPIEEINYRQSIICEYGGKRFTVFINHVLCEANPLYVMYFVDDTYLKNIADEYFGSLPFVMFLSLDNREEWTRQYADSDFQEMTNSVQRIIEQWLKGRGALFRKLSSGRYLVVGEERCLTELAAEKFKVLEQVRAYMYGGKSVGASLSIGVGKSGRMAQCETDAAAALDMARGRGGDQAVLKAQDEFSFFGGVLGGIETRSKIGARVIASSMAELIEGTDLFIIMGHRFADFDSIGAAFGMYTLARSLGKLTRIVVTKETALAGALIEKIESAVGGEVFIEPQSALAMVTNDTLLCVVDTHRTEFTESPELFKKVSKAIVIDHHRKTVDHIAGAAIFYHEPFASSSCEMVTEVLGYSKSLPKIDPLTAEALLSGIVLDTKDFVLRAGARTFEAAAALKDCGANTVSVRRLFSGTREENLLKNAVIAGAQSFGEYAVALCDSDEPYTRISCARAADELLELKETGAAFVLYKSGDTVSISARSLGDVNVQLIMEALGGGGHNTMAAAQMSGITLLEGQERLKSVLGII